MPSVGSCDKCQPYYVQNIWYSGSLQTVIYVHTRGMDTAQFPPKRVLSPIGSLLFSPPNNNMNLHFN